MQIKVLGTCSTNAQRVHPRITEAEEIIEHNRMQGLRELQQAGTGGVQMPSFIGGTDNEHAHVLKTGCCDCRLVVLTDEVPVQVHVIENARFDGIDNQIGVSMGGEAHMTDPTFGLPAAHDIKAASGSDRLIEMGMEIDAMNRQQIDTIHIETGEGQFEISFEKRRIGLRWNLGLQDSRGIRTIRKRPAQLSL